MKGKAPTDVGGAELDRRQFLKAAGAATALGAASALGIVLLFGCGPQKAQQSEAQSEYRSIRLVGGSLGGITTTAFMVLATVFNKYYPEIAWSSSSGSTGTNPIYVTKGSVKLAAVTPANYVDAYGFDKIAQSRLRSINLPTPLLQYSFFIPEDKPWKDITEVPKGLTMSPGPPGTGTVVAAEAWLKLCGLSKADFNWVPSVKTEMVDAWRAGKIDISFFSAQGTAPFLMDMATSPRKPKLLGLTPEQAARAKAEKTFERIGFEAPAMGNLSELAPELFKYDVISIQQPAWLVSRDDFPEDIAYRMAKIIEEHHPELVRLYPAMKYGAAPQHHIKWASPAFEIHPGVTKYYREKDYLK